LCVVVNPATNSLATVGYAVTEMPPDDPPGQVLALLDKTAVLVDFRDPVQAVPPSIVEKQNGSAFTPFGEGASCGGALSIC